MLTDYEALYNTAIKDYKSLHEPLVDLYHKICNPKRNGMFTELDIYQRMTELETLITQITHDYFEKMHEHERDAFKSELAAKAKSGE